MAIKKTRKHTALAASALGLLGLAPQTASADAVNNDQTDAAKEASSAASSNAFAQAASDAHNEFSSAANMLDSSSVANSQASSSSADDQSSAASKEVNAPAESQKTNSDSTNVNTNNVKTETAEQQAASQSGGTNNVKVNAAKNTANKQNTVTLNVKDVLKTSKAAVNKKMVMASLASTKLADQYEAKGAEYTEIYGQTIDPKSLISNFSELPAGTTVSAANLDAIKGYQGRHVVPVTVTYSDKSTDTVNSIVWVTPSGTTALAKSVSLQSNAATDKPEITVGINDSVNLPFRYTGTAVVNGSDIIKGAQIYFSSLAEKYGESIGMGPSSAINVVDNDNDVIGNLYVYNSPNMRSFMLNVTTAKKYEGNVTIRFDAKNDDSMYNVWQGNNNLRSIYLINTDDPYDYSGTVVQKRWLHAAGQNDKKYTINRIVSPVEAGTTRGPNYSELSTSAVWEHITVNPNLVGCQGSSANPKNTTITGAEAWKIADEIWKGKGKVKPTDLPEEANWHEIFQVTTNVSELPDNFNIGDWSLEGDVQAATADGQPSNQIFRMSTWYDKVNAKVVRAADNLSIQQLYDETSSGQISYSKQPNGQFLICFNLSAKDLTPTDKTIYSNLVIGSAERNGNIALSKDYDKITKATVDFYVNNAVPNFAAWYQGFWLSVNGAHTSDRKWIMTDVTPGDPAYSVTSSYSPGTASANGKLMEHNVAYFVDDSNNQAIVGGTHQISGGVGDTVPLNLTTPSGYILASGQALPTSYTFTGSDSDIVIHLVPIYKSVGQTSDVHRTIDYKTTDGSPAPASKSDDLKFYGTTVTGDLSNLTNRAGQDGLTVTKEDAKTYASKQEALTDLDKQATAIQNALIKYEAEKAAYDAAKKVYDQDMDKWKTAQNDPHAVKGISQSLQFAGEKDADLDVTSGTDKPVNFIKSSAWLGSDNQGVYNIANITKSFGDSDISYSFAEGTGADINGWGKSYTGIQLKTGESIVARYTGLKNSIYVDSTGAAHKLSKVQIKYTLNSTTANDGTANVFLSNNPNIALWYGAAAGKSDGSVDFTVDLTFYDENGNPITLDKGSNAWLNMGSLNRGDNKIEYFAPNGNTAMKIPESTIVSHADGWYADSNNEGNSADWDSSTSANRYYGAAIMELEGNAFHIGQKITGSNSVYSWNAFDSSLAAAYKPVKPTAPVKPPITWHEVTSTTWDGPKDFADVQSPTIKGYTPDQETVSNDGIEHSHADIAVTVTYSPDKQTATVAYIDDTTGTTLKTDNLKGGSNAKSGYTTKSEIDSYVAAGYDLVSDSTNGQEIVYDNNGDVDQDYTVHLKHRFIQPSDSDHVHHTVVTRTINYQMSDGSTPPTSRILSLSFTGQDTIDAVTKETVKTDWTGGQDFAEVASPIVQGYTPDQAVVPKLTATHDSANTTVIVRYTPDPQKATVAYLDDTTGKTLDTIALRGVSNAKSGYTTKSAIDAYKFVGYQFVSDPTGGQEIVFDHDDAAQQNYVVHLKRTYEEVQSPQKKYVHRTITYVMADGSSAPIPVTQTLIFTGKDTVDSITKQVISTVWSGDQSFAEVNVPTVNGYTPDRTIIPAIAVGHDHEDINEVVTYKPNPISSTVTYVDDATGKTLKTDDLSGMAGQLTGYSTANTIDNYLAHGYKLVSDETGQNDIIMPANRTNFMVHLTHTTEEVNDDSLNKTVTRTIHYVVEGGDIPAPNDRTDMLTFTAKVVKDKVTGQILKTAWSPERSFSSVKSPAITGYTPDLPLVADSLVGHDSSDIKVTVIYTKDKPSVPPAPIVPESSITVSYIDQTTGKLIKKDTKTGKSASSLDYRTANQIKNLENAGYILVKDETAGKALTFTNADQSYSVILKHGQDIDTVNKTVNRTIKYVMTDGTTPPNSVKDSLTFKETVVKDKVTGQIVSTDWSPNQDFRDVQSPVIKGYTFDRAVVSDKNIAHDHADIVETVVYRPSTQKATVTYIDETTGTVLENVDLSGYSNTGSGYTTANSLKIWEAYGYELVKDETGGKPVYFDSDSNANQNYTVTLKHGTKTEDTNAVVKRVIDYVVQGGKVQAPSPVHDSLTFKGTVTIDKVTGKVAKVVWSDPQDFKDITSPILPGYKVDRTIVSDKAIAHDHPDIHEIVTYTPDTQKAKVIYVDDSNNQVLKTDDIAGDPGVDSGYNTKSVIETYLNNGYELVSDDTNGENVVLDDDSTVDQTYYVHFKHNAVVPNSPQTSTKTITSTDKYVMVDEPTPPVSVKNAETLIKTLVTKDAKAEIPAKPETHSSMASSAVSSVASSASSAVSSAASSAPSSALSVASSASNAAPLAPSSVASSASSTSSSTPSSVASNVASSAPSSVAIQSASAALVKTLPQTGTDELAAVMESVLGLANAIAGGGLLKKKYYKKDKQERQNK